MAYNQNSQGNGEYSSAKGLPPQVHFPAAVQYPAPQGQIPYQQQQPNLSLAATNQQQFMPVPPYSQDVPGNKQAYPSSPQYPTDAPTETAKTPWDPNQATGYTGNDIAGEDNDENGAEVQICASAPSYDLVISGYENITSSNGVPVGPPPSYDSVVDMLPAMVDSSGMLPMNAEVAREALLELVSRQTCWGQGAATNMNIDNVTPTNAFYYVLETYTEGRSTCPAHVPYMGGRVDGPHKGTSPLPWQIPCSPTSLFNTEQHKVAVPHTETVKSCHLCGGRGFNRCTKCLGRGRVRCGFCHGRGHKRVHRDGNWHDERCFSCHGSGRRQCFTCRGSGCVVCIMCSGYGSVKQFIQLTVAFTNRHSEHILEKTDLPDELIRKVDGDTIFEQTLPRVKAIENFYEEEINQKSREMVDRHATSWPAERVLQQKHYLRSVPVHECHFEYHGKDGRFWVYGNNKEVYTNDYPHTCCCCRGCVIL